MNTRGGNTAADVLNTYEEEQLARIFQLFGELKNARRLASAIVKARGTKPLAQIADLLACVHPLVPKEREKKDLAKVFQALRIEVTTKWMCSAHCSRCTPRAQARRPTFDSYLPQSRRSYGEKLHAGGQHRRKSGTRFLRQPLGSPATGQQ